LSEPDGDGVVWIGDNGNKWMVLRRILEIKFMGFGCAWI
jgi:hypothetical protein